MFLYGEEWQPERDASGGEAGCRKTLPPPRPPPNSPQPSPSLQSPPRTPDGPEQLTVVAEPMASQPNTSYGKRSSRHPGRPPPPGSRSALSIQLPPHPTHHSSQSSLPQLHTRHAAPVPHSSLQPRPASPRGLAPRTAPVTPHPPQRRWILRSPLLPRQTCVSSSSCRWDLTRSWQSGH